MSRRTTVLLVLLSALPSAAAADVEAPRSRAIYPPQRIALRFEHQRHLATGVLWCEDCHPDAQTSGTPGDDLLPTHRECGRCHEVAAPEPGTRPANDCGLCHPGASEGGMPGGVVVPPANLRFSHARHAAEGATCATCHGDLRTVGRATRQQLPEMATCLGCHDGRRAPSACTTCHLEDASGRLRVDWPSGVLEPKAALLGADHGAGWRLTHAEASRREPALCATCHTEQSCMDCHDGILKPFEVHPADWLSTHPVAANQASLECRGCHREQSFCVTCHERQGLGPQAPAGRVLGAAPATDPTFRLPACDQVGAGEPCREAFFHGEGWVTAVGDPGRHHSYRARRNLQSCVSCHREEGCLECHALPERGGLGVGPHPPDFQDRCGAAARRNPRACLKCHGSVPDACR